MPKCIKCKSCFFKVNALIVHLKILHGYSETSLFECGVDGCNRNFPSLKTFRRHGKKHETTFSESNDISEVACNSHGVPELSNDILFVHSSTHVERLTKINELLDVPLKENINLKEFQVAIFRNNISLMCNLYSENTFCRSDVQKIIDHFNLFLIEPLNIFQRGLFAIFIDKYSMSDCDIHDIKRYFEEFQHLFKNFETEHLRFKYLEKSGYFIKPEEYVVGQHLQREKLSTIPKHYTAQY